MKVSVIEIFSLIIVVGAILIYVVDIGLANEGAITIFRTLARIQGWPPEWKTQIVYYAPGFIGAIGLLVSIFARS